MKEKLEEALNAIWEVHGNGWDTEWQKLVEELQIAIERLEVERKRQMRNLHND